MQPAPFEYFAPSSLKEAAMLLGQSTGFAQIIAGGQSLVPAMNLRVSRPSVLIDLRNVPNLDLIEINGDRAIIGARVTHAQIIRSEVLGERLPILRAAGKYIAHATVRESGTFAGSLALADPAAEWGSVFLALAGTVRAYSVRGEREIVADDFFESFYTTALASDEIITQIELPLARGGDQYAFLEFSRQSGAFALALAAARIRMDSRGTVSEGRVVVGGCGDKPILIDVSGLLACVPTVSAIQRIVSRMDLQASGDIHASSEHRKQIAATILRRCLEDACGICGS
jgi:aerobic carbon-monoxide dehydrogenase medium subunit